MLIDVTEFPMVMPVNFEHHSKQYQPSDVTELGMVTDVRLEKYVKQY